LSKLTWYIMIWVEWNKFLLRHSSDQIVQPPIYNVIN
jgi:hypothetical protein